MFQKGKIVTSLISLLFFSRQISFVTAAITPCPDFTDVNDGCSTVITSGCTTVCSSSGKLYFIDNATPTEKKELTGGYYLFKNDGSLTTTGAGTTLYLATSTGATLQENVKDGFYINTDQSSTNYIKCKGGSCTVETNPTASDECEDSTIGQLTKSNKLCLNGSIDAAFEASGEKKYLVSYATNNVFSTSVSQDHYGVVVVTENSMTIDTSTTSNTEVCASDTTLVITAPTSGACGDNITLYSLCTNGICQKICKVGSGVNCSASTYYLVDGATDSVPVTGTTAGHLYYCDENISCEEVSAKGYYVNDKDSAYSCTGTAGECKIETIATAASCTAQTIGKLALDGTNPIICLGATTSKKFTSNDGNYLMSFLANNIFGITTGKMGLVKIEKQSVTLISDNGYVVEKTSNIVAAVANDEGTLYSCTAGICTSIGEESIKYGAYLNVGGTGTHIICQDKCKITTDPQDDTCNTGQLLLDTNLFICLDGTSKAGFTETAKKYLVKHDASSIFTSITGDTDNYGLIEANSTAITIDTTYSNDYGVCIDTNFEVKKVLSSSSTSCDANQTKYGFCSGGVCYQPCEVTSDTGEHCKATTYYLVKDKTLGTPVTSDTEEGYLYYCAAAGAACTEKMAKGYYVNSATDAYKCTGTSKSCTKVDIAATATCGAATSIGNLVLSSGDPSICLNYNTAGIENVLSTAGTFLMSYASNNIFGITEGKMGLISVKDNSATLMDATGYCAEDGANSNKLGTSSSSTVNLYYCSAGLCEATTSDNIKIGYYRNLDGTTAGTSDYIKCTLSGTTKTCTVINVSADSCTNAGDLIYVTSDTAYKVCLTSSTPVALDPDEGTTDGNYFVDVNTSNVFGNKNSGYTLIDIVKENVFVHEKGNINIYTIGKYNKKNKIINKTNI